MNATDAEDHAYEHDPDFWKMIEDRPRQVGIPWEEVEAELLAMEDD